MAQPRDHRGRFMKRPKAPPLGPQVLAKVKAMAEQRPVIDDWTSKPITLEIYEHRRASPKRPWRVIRQGQVIEESRKRRK